MNKVLPTLPDRLLKNLLILVGSNLALFATSALRAQGVYDGPFTNVPGATPNLSYDTGGYLTTLSPNQIYTGPLISEGGGGGFVVSTSGGMATVNDSPAWGGELPNGSALILGADVYLAGDVFLGIDPTATRQIDAGMPTSFTYDNVAEFISGEISGAGSLLIQNYSQTSPATFYGETTLYTNGISITGGITVNNVALWGENTGGSEATVSATFFQLSNANLEAPVAGTPNMTLTNDSEWAVNSINTDSHSIDTLNGDSTSSIDLGFVASSGTVTLTVDSGYFAGTLLSDNQNSLVGTKLIKDGAGIFTLAGNNLTAPYGETAFTGQTIIEQGTLLASNTIGSATGTGSVTVMSGGALGGTGKINTVGLEVQSGGKIDLTAFDSAHPPTSAFQALAIAVPNGDKVNFDSGATFAFDIGPAGESNTLALSETYISSPIFYQPPHPFASFNDNAVDFDFPDGSQLGTYTLFTFNHADGYTGTLQNGSDYFFTYDPESITVTFTPEPSTWATLALGLGMLGLVTRRKRMNPCAVTAID